MITQDGTTIERPAVKFAYLTQPEAGQVVLNIQIGDGEFQRVLLNAGHIANLVADGAKLLAGMQIGERG